MPPSPLPRAWAFYAGLLWLALPPLLVLALWLWARASGVGATFYFSTSLPALLAAVALLLTLWLGPAALLLRRGR